MRARKPIVVISLITGTLAILGSGFFAAVGAGVYGSPFAGDGYFNTTLLFVLLCGPVAVLPCTLVDCWKPGYGGIVLCGLAEIEVLMISLNNIRAWGFAIHDAALGSLCLALPMFAIGSMLFVSGKPQVERLSWLWWMALLLAASVITFFLWHVGADGVRALLCLLRGGTN